MNKIIINHGSFKVKEVELEHGTLTVGRAADNGLKLDDSAVSSHHAKLVTFFNVTYIEDLNSTNGTLVNGRPVKKYTLHTGDIVLLGKHQLLFQGARMEENAGGDSTIVMSSQEKNAAIASAEDRKQQASKPSFLNSSRIPMKQDGSEPVGRLNESSNLNSRSSGNSDAQPTAMAFAQASATPATAPSGNFGSTAPVEAKSETPYQIANKKSPFADNLASRYPANNKIEAAPSPAAALSSHANETSAAAASPEFENANDSDVAVEERPSQPAAPIENPFKAAFPDESADKIDINDVPAIGKFSEDKENSLNEKSPEEDFLAHGGPETSSANLYNVQALSQVNAEAAQAAKIKAEKEFLANIPVDGDESLLIPAFAKKMENPDSGKSPFASVSHFNERSEQKISPVVEKLFEEEEKAKLVKPSRKVLEDPSVNMGDDFQGMTPVGLSENNRISQYQQRAAASHAGDIPAVGDRTLLKQIITGDREFSPSRNKFEVIQIVLGVVIFVIIALIAVASL